MNNLRNRAHSEVLSMRTTTLVTLLVVVIVVVVGSGFGCDDTFKNEVMMDRTDTETMLSSLSSRQRRHIRTELLHLLGLNHTPHPASGKHSGEAQSSAPKYMLSLYRSLQGYEDSEDRAKAYFRSGEDRFSQMSSRIIEQQLRSADTVTNFVNQADNSGMGRGRRGSGHPAINCRFDLSTQISSSSSASSSSSEVLSAAILRIYKQQKPPRRPVERLTLEVHRTNDNHTVDNSDRQVTLYQRLTVLSTTTGWVDVNITPLASQWSKHPTTNRGLQVIVYNHRGEVIDPGSVGFVGDDKTTEAQVFLVAFFKNKPDVLAEQQLTTNIVRHKRSADETRRNGRKNKQQDSNVMNDDHQVYRNYKHALRCQIRTLKVSFKDLKWQDWIIAPEGYGANYCDGDCVSPLHAHNATNHAIVQKMAHLIKPTSVPKPCCAPTKLAGLSVLYFDDNSNVILKKYRNMVVKACGCH